MTRERFTENLLMLPGMALMVASVWFYLRPVFCPCQQGLSVMNWHTPVPDDLAVMHWRYLLSGRRWGIIGLGLAAFRARKKWLIPQESSDMWPGVLTGVLLIATSVQASTLEELRQPEAPQDNAGNSQYRRQQPLLHHLWLLAVPERGITICRTIWVVNLKNYKLVLFMQSRCGYCQPVSLTRY